MHDEYNVYVQCRAAATPERSLYHKYNPAARLHRPTIVKISIFFWLSYVNIQ